MRSRSASRACSTAVAGIWILLNISRGLARAGALANAVAVGDLDIGSIERYWDFGFREPDGPVDEREYVEELDRLFRQAVNRQLVSDVDIGAYLSGGMDSGSIIALAARQLPYIRSFTCGFDLNSASGVELGFDERDGEDHGAFEFLLARGTHGGPAAA